MKKFITLMNPITFYYIWNSKYKHHLVNLINDITNIKEIFILVDTFNTDNKNLKSYIFLESENYLIYLDFNRNNDDAFVDNCASIINYLKTMGSKEVILILFNPFKKENSFNEYVNLIYKNEENNSFIKLILSNNFKEQKNEEFQSLLDYIYKLDEKFYNAYLKEENHYK